MYVHITQIMAEISDVYGDHYRDDMHKAKTMHLVNLLATNIAHRQFSLTNPDLKETLWTMGQFSTTVMKQLSEKVHNINPKMGVILLDKQSEQLNLLPELVVDIPVEYLMVIDGELHRAYYIYITPFSMNAY